MWWFVIALLLPTSAAAASLSDEQTLSRWAHPVEAAPVYVKPSSDARRNGRLRYFTEDQQPEVYMVLEQTLVEDREWVRIRIPDRPNGQTGWVRRGALGKLRAVHGYLRINRKTLRATLYGAKGIVWRARIGVGAPRTPTPKGRYYIRQRIRNLNGSPVYGPLAFGTSAYSRLSDWPGGGVIGIHGTNQPHLLPGRVSHGCIRMRNIDILRLGKLLRIGTPVHII